MKTIRASDLGTYLYCKRAWWYQEDGITPENQVELEEGTLFHQRHGAQVVRAALLRLAGWALLLVALGTAAVALTIEWLN
jgi:CRISPR/Cas system-associated exonuclease Cas4 (RecB family)